MKQYITKKQLNGLSENGKKELVKWCNKKDIGVWGYRGNIEVNVVVYNKEIILEKPLLSIGQMIEFLEDSEQLAWESILFRYDFNCKWVDKDYDGEFCDALFELVKNVLKGEYE